MYLNCKLHFNYELQFQLGIEIFIAKYNFYCKLQFSLHIAIFPPHCNFNCKLQIFLGQKKFWVKNFFGPKNFWGSKNKTFNLTTKFRWQKFL